MLRFVKQVLDSSNINQIISNYTFSKSEIQQLIANGGLSREEILQLIKNNTLSRDEISTLINENLGSINNKINNIEFDLNKIKNDMNVVNKYNDEIFNLCQFTFTKSMAHRTIASYYKFELDKWTHYTYNKIYNGSYYFPQVDFDWKFTKDHNDTVELYVKNFTVTFDDGWEDIFDTTISLMFMPNTNIYVEFGPTRLVKSGINTLKYNQDIYTFFNRNNYGTVATSLSISASLKPKFKNGFDPNFPSLTI